MGKNMTVNTDDLLSAMDIAKRYDYSPSTVSNWQKRHSDFPQPLFVVNGGRTQIFSARAVDRWYKQNYTEV